ncbi:hypothetical protein [Thauera sp.]|uniref:hypothetical protein n=1 Tax=unclassified Thauera TaxID=2609274 RepID=UPI002B6B90EE|nr:hypothetical protein [Thauera sp.]HRP26090.1 hypothetical protein [Thauera sp.]
MSAFALILLAWLAFTIALLARHASALRALWREPVLTRPVVIIESDDWGPGPESDGAMLQRIAEKLMEFRDRDGHPAVMTLGVVLGRPDGAAILATECRSYRRSTLDEARYMPIVQAMRDGCATGVFALQRHGLEHCWPDSLLSRAREDVDLRRWLADPDARSEALPSALQSRWVDTATLPSRPLAARDVEAVVKEEGDAFLRIFGQRPSVAVPNTFVWDDAIEQVWAADGVQCVVTCGRRFDGRDAAGGLMPGSRRILNGEDGKGGVRYVVRDVYFEPIRGHRAEHVWRGVAERTALGRPVLIETHRESFIASADSAQQALAELVRTFQGIVRQYPDVCFLNTAALVDTFRGAGSSLICARFLPRLTCFLSRLLVTPELSRVLKLSGLRVLIRLIIRLLTSVKLAWRDLVL